MLTSAAKRAIALGCVVATAIFFTQFLIPQETMLVTIVAMAHCAIWGFLAVRWDRRSAAEDRITGILCGLVIGVFTQVLRFVVILIMASTISFALPATLIFLAISIACGLAGAQIAHFVTKEEA